jgi:hypothetical protein
MNMKKLLPIIFLFLLVKSSYSQHLVAADYLGRPLSTVKNTEVNGSPFINESFTNTSVLLKDGRKINDVLLNFDIYVNEPIFTNKSGTYFRFNQEIFEFILPVNSEGNITHALFRNGYKAQNKYNERTFYQVIYEGNKEILKHTQKLIVEDQTSLLTSRKKYEIEVNYFLLVDGEMKKFHNKSTFLKAFGKDNDKARKFLEVNDIDFSSDFHLKTVMEFIEK